MALTPEQTAKLQQQLQEIERLSRSLGTNINTINLQPLEQNAGNIEAIFERLTRQAADIGGETDYLVSNFQKLVGEIKNSGTGINNSAKALKNLSSITEQISNYQKGYSDLSAKDIIKLKDKVKIETDRLKNSSKIIGDEIEELKLKKNGAGFSSLEIKQQQLILDKLAKNELARTQINTLLENEDITLGEINNKLKESEDNAKKIEKALGLTGATLKGISKIPILGNIIDTEDALKAAKDYAKEAGDAATRTGAMKAAFKNIGSQIKTGITDPLVVGSFLITQFVDALKSADKATGDLAKSFNMTYKEASDTREVLIQMGNTSGNIALNAKSLQESMVAIGNALGSNARLNTEDLKTFTELREMAGYTNEELVGMQKITLATNGNLKNNTKQFLGTVSALNSQNKLTINEKQLLKEVANTSAAIKLSVGATSEGLAKSAFQAKQFGINLQQADQISQSLLDFETSISNELSAELITGKDLNLEKARLLALNGDIAGASAEILKQVKGSAEFTKMNRIQQESLAKAVGMGREELAASLIEREALSKIGEKDAASAKAKFDLLVKEKGYAAAVVELGDEQYANQLKQQSIAEQLSKTVENLKETFVSLVQPLLPVLDVFTAIIGAISRSKVAMLALQTVITGLAVKSIVTAIASIFTGSAVLGPVGLGIAAAATAGMMGMIAYSQSKVQAAGDMYSPANGRTQVSTKEGGLFELSKNDSLMAFPESKIKNNLNKSSSNIVSSQQDLSPLLEEMRALRQEQSRSNNKPVIVENSMNGTKFGTSVAMNTYKIQ